MIVEILPAHAGLQRLILLDLYLLGESGEGAVELIAGERRTALGTEADEEGVVFDNYNLEDVEKVVIRKVLKKHEGNVSHAARDLGLTRTSLYRRMEKYGL